MKKFWVVIFLLLLVGCTGENPPTSDFQLAAQNTLTAQDLHAKETQIASNLALSQQQLAATQTALELKVQKERSQANIWFDLVAFSMWAKFLLPLLVTLGIASMIAYLLPTIRMKIGVVHKPTGEPIITAPNLVIDPAKMATSATMIKRGEAVPTGMGNIPAESIQAAARGQILQAAGANPDIAKLLVDGQQRANVPVIRVLENPAHEEIIDAVEAKLLTDGGK